MMLKIILLALFPLLLLSWIVIRRKKSTMRILAEVIFLAFLMGISIVGFVFWEANRIIEDIPTFSLEELETSELDSSVELEEELTQPAAIPEPLEQQVFLIYTLESTTSNEEGLGGSSVDTISVFIKDRDRVVSVNIPRELYSCLLYTSDAADE